MIRGVHHVSFSTQDLDAMLGFYCDLLGFQLVKPPFTWAVGFDKLDTVTGMRGTSGRNALLRAANIYIEIFEYATPKGRPADPARRAADVGLTHLCFDVDNIDSDYQRLAQAGVRFHCPPQHLGSALSTYGRDPDGNIFELQQILDYDKLPAPLLGSQE